MPDIFSKKKRSIVMAKIRSKGTKIEIAMKEALEKSGMQAQYQPKISGRPDFFVPPNITVFCDSSFWHGRNWSTLKNKLSKRYWYDHIKRNIERDKEVTEDLKEKGFVVLRFWDFEIEKQMEECIEKIKRKKQIETRKMRLAISN